MRWGDGQLQWSRPSWFRREFEIRSGESRVATLRIGGVFRAVGVFTSDDGTWTMAREGFLRTRATIRSGEHDVAEFRSNAFGHAGDLTFASGSRFTLSINFWMTRLEVRSQTGEPVLVLHRRGFCGRTGDVEIAPTARSLAELPLLAAFGLFQFAMLEQDAGAVVVTG